VLFRSFKLTIVAGATLGGTYPGEWYERGATVVVSRYRQSRFDPTVGHKTTSYFARLAALREAHAAGALEALWLDDKGQVAEGAISSVFAVRGGRVHTPALDTPILPGITRAAVLELAAELQVAVEESALAVADLCAAEEVFLTNSMMEVMPVVRVGTERIGAGRPGELTRRLALAYAQWVREECGHG
jgi:branched-chain amino acid aminotransferase